MRTVARDQMMSVYLFCYTIIISLIQAANCSTGL